MRFTPSSSHRQPSILRASHRTTENVSILSSWRRRPLRLDPTNEGAQIHSIPTLARARERHMGRSRRVSRSSGGRATFKSTSSKRSSSTSSAPAYTYQVNLSGGRKYIGMARTKSSLKTRIATQLTGGRGASVVCANNRALSVSRVFKHADVAAAKRAETKRYHSTKAALGADKVRGAGHTKDFKK